MTRQPPPHRRPRDPFAKAQRAPQIRQAGPSPLAAEIRAVDSEVWCHAELRLSTGKVQAVCRLPIGHDGSHKDGPTRWGVQTPEWSVRHPGIGVLAYDTEDEARVAAGTAGTLLHWGQEVP